MFSPEWKLNNINCRKLYYDKHSYEEYSKTLKPKYKLAIKQEAVEYVTDTLTFFVTTSKPRPKNKACLITQKDWEHIEKSFVNKLSRDSYIPYRSLELIKKEDLLEKLSHSKNGFQYVSTLKQDKYDEFLDNCVKCIKQIDVSVKKQKQILKEINTDLANDFLEYMDRLNLENKAKNDKGREDVQCIDDSADMFFRNIDKKLQS